MTSDKITCNFCRGDFDDAYVSAFYRKPHMDDAQKAASNDGEARQRAARVQTTYIFYFCDSCVSKMNNDLQGVRQLI